MYVSQGRNVAATYKYQASSKKSTPLFKRKTNHRSDFETQNQPPFPFSNAHPTTVPIVKRKTNHHSSFQTQHQPPFPILNANPTTVTVFKRNLNHRSQSQTQRNNENKYFDGLRKQIKNNIDGCGHLSIDGIWTAILRLNRPTTRMIFSRLWSNTRTRMGEMCVVR